MADGFALAELVEVRLDVSAGMAKYSCRKRRRPVGRRLGAAARVLAGDELDAVAGGEDQAFADAGLMRERADGVGEARQREWRGARGPRCGAVV